MIYVSCSRLLPLTSCGGDKYGESRSNLSEANVSGLLAYCVVSFFLDFEHVLARMPQLLTTPAQNLWNVVFTDIH